MASSYVNNLRLDEMATGDGSGTWGTTTNRNLTLIGEALGYATVAIANASTDTLTIPNGTETDSEPRRMYLKLTGGGQACTVTLAPNTSSKVWIIENVTSYTLTFTQGSGANVAILAGETKMIATDGLGSGAVVYDVLTDLNLAGTTKTAALTNAGALSNQGTVTVGVDDTGYDVKLFGATSGKYLLWDESADSLIVTGSTSQQGTLTVGVDDTGYDVKLFGATSGKYWLWDESADGVLQYSTLTVGVDDTGYDVKFFGATSGAYMLWDESADDLVLAGAAGLDIAGDIDVDGTANLDVVDIDGAVDMASTLQVDGTITGNLTGNVTGNASGTALTVTQAAQSAITSLGSLTGLTVEGLAKFDQYGSSAGHGRIEFGNSGEGYIQGIDTGNGGSGAYLKLGLNTTDVIYINDDFNLGIGTDSPDQELDVDGEIRAADGMLFGTDTAAANALDDYEEGTFTPVFIGGSGTSGSAYSIQAGFYTKIGRMVQWQAYLTLSTLGTLTGTIKFSGLPFTTSSTDNANTAVALARVEQWSLVTNYSLYLHIDSGGTGGTFTQAIGGTSASIVLNSGHMESDSSLILMGTYFV